MRPAPLALALLAAALALLLAVPAPATQAQTSTRRADFEITTLEFTRPERPPAWIDGTPTQPSFPFHALVTNRGNLAASYTLSFEWVPDGGPPEPLNGQASASIIAGPALLPNESEDWPVPWSLQAGQQGWGVLRAIVDDGSERTVRDLRVFVSFRQVAFTVQGEGFGILPGETRFVRAVLENLGNVNEISTLTVVDPGEGDNARLGLFFDPSVSLSPHSSATVVLYLERPFDGLTTPFGATYTLEAALGFRGPLDAQTPVVQNDDGSDGYPSGFEFTVAPAHPGTRFAASGAAVEVPVVLGNVADPAAAADLSDTYRLFATASAGWTVDAPQRRAALHPGEGQTFAFQVHAPPNALPGATGRLDVTAVSDHGAPSRSAEVDLQVSGHSVEIADIAVEPEVPYVGETVALGIRLSNQGDHANPADAGRLTVSFLPTHASLPPRTLDVPELAVGESVELSLDAAFPQGGSWLVRAVRSDAAGTSVPSERLLPLFVHAPRLTILAPASAISGVPGERVGYQAPPSVFVVRNDGNAAETVKASASSNLGSARVEGDESISLDPGESRSIPVAHLLPLPAGRATGSNVTLRVEIEARPSLAWNATVRTTIVDRSPPRLSVDALPPLWTVDAPLPIQAAASDDGAVDRVVAALNVSGVTQLLPLTQDRVRWTAETSLGLGNHTVAVRAWDAANNSVNSTTYKVQVKAIPAPVLQILGIGENSTLARNGTIAVSISDELAVHSVTLMRVTDGRAGASATFPVENGTALLDLAQLPLQPGTERLRVEAVNVAGARANAEFTVTIPPEDDPVIPTDPGKPAKQAPSVSFLGQVGAVGAAIALARRRHH